jgi:nucleotide-binding universal stress UspA family protein
VRILLAVDGSESSVRAARKLVDTLDWYKERPAIELLTVHLPIPKFGHMGSVITHEMVERYYREETEAAVTPVAKVLDAAGAPYTTHVVVGPIAPSIVEQAAALGCDLIYMGTRGHGGLANMVLGSTATKVLHLAKSPVVLIH